MVIKQLSAGTILRNGPVTEKMTTATIGPTMLAACSSINFRVLNSDRSPVLIESAKMVSITVFHTPWYLDNVVGLGTRSDRKHQSAPGKQGQRRSVDCVTRRARVVLGREMCEKWSKNNVEVAAHAPEAECCRDHGVADVGGAGHVGGVIVRVAATARARVGGGYRVSD